MRRAEKAGNVKVAADLRYQIDLLEIDSKVSETENSKRLRDIRRLYFVRGAQEKEQAALLYQADRVPAGMETDGRRWHVKKIEHGEMKLVGGGDVVGSIPRGLPSVRLPAFSLDAAPATAERRSGHCPGCLHGIHLHGQGHGQRALNSASIPIRS